MGRSHTVERIGMVFDLVGLSVRTLVKSFIELVLFLAEGLSGHVLTSARFVPQRIAGSA